MDEIEQVAAALESVGLPAEAYLVRDIIRRQYRRNGYTPWSPGKPLPVDTMAFLIRNWVSVFDIPIWNREWRDRGYVLLEAAMLLEVRLS